jgi:hypothetical protein
MKATRCPYCNAIYESRGPPFVLVQRGIAMPLECRCPIEERGECVVRFELHGNHEGLCNCPRKQKLL